MAGGDTVLITVRGSQVEAALIHQCQNTSTPELCGESQDVTVGFTLQGDVSAC